MSNIKNWSTTAASNNSASPNGAPEGMPPSAVNDIMRQQMADHRTQWQDAEWFDWGHVPTRTGNSTFTVPTDLTSVYTANRRLKCSDASTIYASILSSSYTAVTTVTVVTDSGNLSASLSSVAVGIMTNLGPPVRSDAYPIVAGSSDPSKRLRFEVDGLTTATTRVATPPDYDFRVMSQTHGSDISSASTLNLDTATGDLVDVTGTTTITAITLAEGKWATVRFTGILTLTHGSSLVLPGAANITTAAGDFAVFRGYSGGVVRCSSYVKADGTPVVVNTNGTLITLSTAQATTSGTSIDFTSIPSWVKRVNVLFNGVSTSGTSEVLIQIGAGSVDTSGYLAAAMRVSAATTSTAGFCVSGGAHTAATTLSGTITLSLVGSNIWASSGNLVGIANATAVCSAGGKTLSGTLDRVRLTTTNGTDTFDAGSVNISYE